MKTNGRVKTQNQQNPPLPKKKRVDSKGNSYVRIIAREGGSSHIICEHLTENAAKAFVEGLKDLAEKLGGIIPKNVTFKPIR